VLNAIVRFSLQQRIILVVIAVALGAFGVRALNSLSVDAFPDVTNVQVQIATEAPGRSPEEVERFITVPLEIAMTGLPGLTEMRSLNRNGLSLITLVFRDDVDVYFARQLVMERIIEVRSRLPEDVAPILGPVSTGLGEVYQYTLEKPTDKGKALSEQELMERRTIQDWMVRPLLRSVAGVAEINSQGGFERQYHVKVNPDRMRHYRVTLNEVYGSLSRNNANSRHRPHPVRRGHSEHRTQGGRRHAGVHQGRGGRGHRLGRTGRRPHQEWPDRGRGRHRDDAARR
jgi:cobalt-zinc-cadmium resistance protein CzcA